jgi:hypothetical protein
MDEKMENPPGLSALKDAVKVMVAESAEISNAAELLAVRVRMHSMKVDLVLEALDMHLGTQPPCPVAVYPELNRRDEG